MPASISPGLMSVWSVMMRFLTNSGASLLCEIRTGSLSSRTESDSVQRPRLSVPCRLPRAWRSDSSRRHPATRSRRGERSIASALSSRSTCSGSARETCCRSWSFSSPAGLRSSICRDASSPRCRQLAHNGRRADDVERLVTEFRSEREYPNNGRPERVAAERDDLATPSREALFEYLEQSFIRLKREQPANLPPRWESPARFSTRGVGPVPGIRPSLARERQHGSRCAWPRPTDSYGRSPSKR